MKRKAIFLVCTALVILAAVPWVYQSLRSRRTQKPFLDSFQGRWELVDRPGNRKTRLTGQIFEFTGDVMTYTLAPGSSGGPAWFLIIDSVDPDHAPPWIDMTVFDRATGNIVAKRRGVFQLEGDRLILCLSRPGEERPEKIDVNADPGIIVWTLKRPD